MRKKLAPEDKRSKILGIKVKEETKKQLNYIAKREGEPLSTHIDKIVEEYIKNYFRKAKINWDALPPNEREGKNE